MVVNRKRRLEAAQGAYVRPMSRQTKSSLCQTSQRFVSGEPLIIRLNRVQGKRKQLDLGVAARLAVAIHDVFGDPAQGIGTLVEAFQALEGFPTQRVCLLARLGQAE